MSAPVDQDLDGRTVARRAVEAAIWGTPIVSVDAMRRAFLRAGAKYADTLCFSKRADWKFLTPTPNASSLYVYFQLEVQRPDRLCSTVPLPLEARAHGDSGRAAVHAPDRNE